MFFLTFLKNSVFNTIFSKREQNLYFQKILLKSGGQRTAPTLGAVQLVKWLLDRESVCYFLTLHLYRRHPHRLHLHRWHLHRRHLHGRHLHRLHLHRLRLHKLVRVFKIKIHYSEIKILMFLLFFLKWDWQDGLAVKIHGCCSRGLGFSS